MDSAVTALTREHLARLKPLERKALLDELAAMVSAGELSLGDAVRLLRSAVLRMNRSTFARVVKLSPRALAQLETPGSNPTLATLTRALAPFGAKVVIAFTSQQAVAPQDEPAIQRRQALRGALARSRRQKRTSATARSRSTPGTDRSR